MLGLRLAWRFHRGTGRRGFFRLLLTALGLGAVTFAALLALLIPVAVHARADRVHARSPVVLSTDAGLTPSFRFSSDADILDNRTWTRYTVDANPGAPVPPGLSRMPGPGETFASPSLVTLAQDPRVRARAPHIVGMISAAGLAGPDDLVSWTGATLQEVGPNALGGSEFGSQNDADSGIGDAAKFLTVEMLILVGVPAGAFLVTTVRQSSAARIRRWAALRLLGTPVRTLVVLAIAENTVAGALGSAFAVGTYAAVNRTLATSGASGFTWYARDTALSANVLVGVTIGAVVLSAMVGSRGLRRVLAGALESRRHPPKARRWVGVVEAVSVAGATGYLLLLTHMAQQGHGLYALPVLIAGAIAALGLFGIVTVSGLVSAPLARRLGLPGRMAAARMRHDSTGVVRVQTGVVMACLVAGVATGVLRSVELASGLGTHHGFISVEGSSLTTEQRGQLWAATDRYSDATMFPTRTGVQASARGPLPTLILSTCEHAVATDELAAPQCQDGRSYLVQDPQSSNPAVPVSVVYDTASGGTVTVAVPKHILSVPGSYGGRLLQAGTILITAHSVPPGGFPPTTQFDLEVDPLSGGLDRAAATVARIAPTAAISSSVDFEKLSTFRVHRGAIRLGLGIGLALAIATIGLMTFDRAQERRRTTASLVVLGSPRSTIRLAALLEVTVPLVLGLVVAVLVAQETSAAYVAAGGDGPQGTYWGAATMTAVLAVIATVGAGLAAAISPGVRPRSGDLRRE